MPGGHFQEATKYWEAAMRTAFSLAAMTIALSAAAAWAGNDESERLPMGTGVTEVPGTPYRPVIHDRRPRDTPKHEVAMGGNDHSGISGGYATGKGANTTNHDVNSPEAQNSPGPYLGDQSTKEAKTTSCTCPSTTDQGAPTNNAGGSTDGGQGGFNGGAENGNAASTPGGSPSGV
jgi:hypothetical protein